MKKDDYIVLIYKNLKGELSPTEQETFATWVAQSKENRDLVAEITQNWQQSEQYLPDLSINTEAEFTRLQNRIRGEKQTAKVVQMKPKRRRWLAVAASLLVLAVAGIWLVTQNTATRQTLVIETGEGEKKSTKLTDGSEIFLNENSQLFLVGDFNQTDRKVAFSGEGYFKIAKNPNRVFSIQTQETTVEVLGTEFNLRSYKEELKTEILVAEGRVRFANSTENALVLTANQAGIFYKKSHTLQKINQPKSNAYAWKSGVLSYKSTPIAEVLADLERVFKVKTTLQNERMKDCPVSGRFPNAKAEAVLEYLASYFKMNLVKISDNDYRLENGNCE